MNDDDDAYYSATPQKRNNFSFQYSPRLHDYNDQYNNQLSPHHNGTLDGGFLDGDYDNIEQERLPVVYNHYGEDQGYSYDVAEEGSYGVSQQVRQYEFRNDDRTSSYRSGNLITTDNLDTQYYGDLTVPSPRYSENVSINQRTVLPVTQTFIEAKSNTYRDASEPNTIQLTAKYRPLPGQFETVRQELVARNELYIDREFPTNDGSLFGYGRKPRYAPYVRWLRPHEIARLNDKDQVPQFVKNGYHVDDIVQGYLGIESGPSGDELGDCYLLAAFSALATYREERQIYINHVIPPGQSFHVDWYAGMFCFRFWNFGKWDDIIIDDYLPTINGKLIYVKSSESNEFWAALVEKAYAKFKGSYLKLDGGIISAAFEDLTGGVAEYYDFRKLNPSDPPTGKQIGTMQSAAFSKHSLMGMGIELQPPDKVIASEQTGQKLRNGLVGGHAYTLVEVKTFHYSERQPDGSDSIVLLRIRNPWGKYEWKFEWSDNSTKWNLIRPDEKQFNFKYDDGSFWMSCEDMRHNFSTFDVCHLPPPINEYWGMDRFKGHWLPGETAGGRPSLIDSYYINPQFEIIVKEDEPGQFVTIIIALLQPYKYQSYFSLGFFLYKLENQQFVPLPKRYLQSTMYTYNSTMFYQAPEIVRRLTVMPGRYAIIPCTYNEGEQSEFLIRILYHDTTAGHTPCIEENGPLCDETAESLRRKPNDTSPRQIYNPMSKSPKKSKSSIFACCTSDQRTE